MSCLAVLLLIAAGSALAENFTVNVGPGNSFSPRNLTIQAGDTVTWTNNGGFHNVNTRSGPETFRCANGCDDTGGNGDPSSAAWSFTRTFNNQGVVAYACDVHEGVGMTGTVTVQAGQQTQPGSLQYRKADYPVTEGGTVQAGVERTGGTDGAVSVQYTTANGSAMAGMDYQAASGTLTWGDGEGGVKTFNVVTLDDAVEESSEKVNLQLSNPTGGATLGARSTATITIADNDAPTTAAGSFRLSQSDYPVGESDGNATVEVERIGGSDGMASVDLATSDGSATAGEDYTAVAATLMFGDGDSAPQSVDVPILDDSIPESAESLNITLSNPTGGADLAARSSGTITITDDDTSFPPCEPSDTVLCLGQDGRFQAEVTFRTADGQTGSGQTVSIGKQDSGLFYFFDANNIELLFKVLNGCGITNHFWVFFAATTDVEFTVTVTDTEGGAQRTYTNPLGQPANAVTDTSAFATCP